MGRADGAQPIGTEFGIVSYPLTSPPPFPFTDCVDLWQFVGQPIALLVRVHGKSKQHLAFLPGLGGVDFSIEIGYENGASRT